MILRIFVFIFFYSTLVFATEVDNLSHRDQISDSTEWLNKKMNDVLLKSGVTTKGCSLADLHKNLYNQIGGGLYAKIELWSEENPNVYKLPINESIYQKVSDRYVSHFGILPVKLGKFYTSGNLKIGDFIVGDDKLGHFAAVGYSIYYSVKKKTRKQFTRCSRFS